MGSSLMPASVPLLLRATSAMPRYGSVPMVTSPSDEVSTTGPLLTACAEPVFTRYCVMPVVMVIRRQNASAAASPCEMRGVAVVVAHGEAWR